MADGDNTSSSKRNDDDWIERVVGIAGSLGFNTMRLRWKLIRWQEARRKRARLREQAIARVTYAHKICRACGAVQDRNEATCTRCGSKLGSRAVQMLGRLGFAMPVAISMSTLLALAILAAYARLWVAAGGSLAGPGSALLVALGGRWPALMSDEPWRLVTAMFLHAGLLHLGFNMLAIANIGPRIEELYGRTTMLALFIVTGALANLATLQVGPVGVGIGASGGVMGLIAAAAGSGHRSGTSYGRALRNDMLKWMAYVFGLGFMIGADNWAHLFGAIAGAAFGVTVKRQAWTRRALAPLRGFVGFVGLAATLGAVAIIFARTPAPPKRPLDARAERAVLAHDVEGCAKLYAGDPKSAIAAMQAMPPPGAGDPSFELTEASVVEICDSLQQLRDECHAASASRDAQTAADLRDICRRYMPVLDRLPVHPHPAPPAPPAPDDADDQARRAP